MHYRVVYDRADGETVSYCLADMDLATAQRMMDVCIKRYVGQPYPNGKGTYNVHNVRLIRTPH